MGNEMQVNSSSASPYIQGDTNSTEAKKNNPIDRLPEMLKDGKISEAEYKELFGEEGAREYNLYNINDRNEFARKINEKYSVPQSEGGKPDIETLKATKKSLELGHEIKHIQQGELYLQNELQNIKTVVERNETKGLEQTMKVMLAFVSATNEENAVDIKNLMNMLTTMTIDDIQKNIKSTNIDSKTLEMLAAVVNTFKKEDGSIDTEGLQNFLMQVAGEGSKANLKEIEVAIKNLPKSEE